MKAVVYSSYGSPDVLQLSEVAKPEPKPNELLVKVFAASVTAGDVRLRASDFPPLFWLPARLMFGLFKPKKKILGHEFAGVVEAVGSKVTTFASGDEVFGTTTMLTTGSYAEYLCVPESWKSGVVAKKPESLSFDESATLPVGAMTALFLLKKAKIDKSKKVLVYGASGSVGSFAVQLAHYFGKSATGVCSTSNVEMVKSLGAIEVIEYNKQDYSALDEEFEIAFDAVGKTNKSTANRVLKKNGSFVSINMITSEKHDVLLELKRMADEGHLKPYIDKTYSLDQIVEAHEYVDSGRKRGNVAIKIRK